MQPVLMIPLDDLNDDGRFFAQYLADKNGRSCVSNGELTFATPRVGYASRAAVQVRSRLTWAERCRRFGCFGLPRHQVRVDAAGRPMAAAGNDGLNGAFIPNEEHLANCERSFGAYNPCQEFMHQFPRGASRMTDIEIVNGWGLELREFCDRGAFEPIPVVHSEFVENVTTALFGPA